MNKILLGTALFVVLLCAAYIFTLFFAAPQPKDVVKVDGGLISGKTEDGIRVYRGIPYAAPPVGDLRWKPPQPVVPWNGVRNATEFAPACPQVKTRHPLGETSEDCLYLNVWTPAKSADEKLPVIVWIHGGGYVSESSGQPESTGINLAKKGVVVVSMDYRLWAFGFLVHPELAKESPNNVSGNYGLLDERAALLWVKNHIAAFGGDPEQVTIFGESAGALSVTSHVASPLSKGLFARAISQSGTIQDEIFPRANGSLEQATDTGEKYAMVLGCDKADDVLKCMRNKTSQELLDALVPLLIATQTPPTNAVSKVKAISFAPVYDGWFFPEPAADIFSKGKQNQVPFMIGYTKDEGTLFVDNMSESEEFGLASMKRPAKFVADSMSSPVYFYVFTRVPPTEEGKKLGAFHSAEIPYVFGTLNASEGYGATDFALSEKMLNYWVNFAKTGDPNGAGLPVWPAYDKQTRKYLEFDENITAKSGLDIE
ncbi:MAG: carboxylesterase/lipase family protein [Candidatus Micrarchaeota archaeon]